MQETLKILFPLVYGTGIKQSQVAKQIYQRVVSYLNDKNQAQQCIYTDKKDREKIFKRLAQSDMGNLQTGIYVQFLVEYGCALLIFKQKIQSSISVQIVVPEEWTTGSNTCKAQKFQFCQPKAQSSIYTPQLAQYQKKLNKFIPKFLLDLKNSIQSNRKYFLQAKQVERYTPEQIQKAVKMTLEGRSFRSYYKYQQKQQITLDVEQQNKKNIKTMCSESIQFSNSNADLSWYVVEAVLRKLIIDKKNAKKNRYKCDKMIIGFKSCILQKAIKQKKEAKRLDIVNYKKCLDQLIFLYRSTVSSHTKEHKKFLQIIKDIQKLIIDAKGGNLSAKIQDKYYLEDQIKIDPVGIPRFIKPKKKMHEPHMLRMARIEQFSYEIDDRFPFESLLDMYENTKNDPQWQKWDAEQKQSFLNHWVLLCQRTIYNIAYQISNKDKKKPRIDLLIHMRQIQCEIGASNVCKLAVVYEKIVADQNYVKHYGMGLKGQAISHVELVKTICAIIAFESVKLNRQKKKSNLNKFKVPIDIEKLYTNFISHDYLARRAMNSIYQYHGKRKNLKPLFQLNGSDNSFKQFGSLVGQQTRSAHVWIACMEQILKLQKQKIVLDIQNKESQQRLNSLQSTKNNIASYGATYYNNDSWKNQTVNSYTQQPLSQFSSNQKWVYAFVHNIPPDILGLVKILFIAQNPKNSQQNLLKDNQFEMINSINTLNIQQMPLRIHNKKPINYETKNINSRDININSIGKTQPINQIKLIYNGSQHSKGFDIAKFKVYDLQEDVKVQMEQNQVQNRFNYQPLQQFLHSPNNDASSIRQHSAYAKQYLKPKDFQIQQFLSLCTTRAAQQTQIIALCKNILNRQIIANCYDVGSKFKQQLLLQTGGQLCAYNYKTEKYFGSIKKFVTQFINIWIFSDVNFAPVLSPFIGFLIRQLRDNNQMEKQYEEIKKIPLELAKKCWEEFLRGQKQLQQNPSLLIQWDQRFIITAAICCFREISLTQNDIDEIMFLTKLILQLRACKIFSDRQQRPKNKRKFETERAFSIEKAIFNNIEVISDFLIVNTHLLGEVLKQMDQGFPAQVEWERKQIYQFQGKSKQNKDIYQIDLFRGFIFKNGKQLSALDPQIKSTPIFKQIFQKRQFQVYPSTSPFYVRTKKNLNYQFKIQKDMEQIFLQFSEDGTDIRYISRKPQVQGQQIKEQIWQLIPQSQLSRCFVHIPRLYLQNHFAWICQEKKCIVFRKRKYQELYDIGLVVHLKNLNQKQYQITKAFHVVFYGGFQNQNLQKICAEDNKIYDEMILRSKQVGLTSFKPYEYISKIQDPEYVFELKNQKTNQIEFLLHRYQLKFKLKKTLLVSESHYGYSIDCSYYDLPKCIFNKFPCLVLKKDPKNEMIMNNHKRIMIVRDGQVKADGKIHKKQEADIFIDSFRYDIHDFFADIRGSTRQSQFHLVALLLSIDNNMRMEWIQMTPLQYGMHVIKTCFTNRPLNKKEQQKLKNIIGLANDEMLLLCEVLWKGSTKLTSILPFAQKQSCSSIRLYQKQLLQSRTLYEKRLQNQAISYRKKIVDDMLRFIGFIIVKNDKEQIQKDSNSSSSQFESQEFWKNLPQYTGQHILVQEQNIENLYKKICNDSKELDYWNRKYPQLIVQQYKFPPTIEKNAVVDDKSLMMKQMIEQLKNSYECFAKEQKRLNLIIKQFSDDKKKEKQKLVQKLKNNCNKCLRQIEYLIKKVKSQNEKHPDIVSGLRPTLSECCYTRLLCEPNQIYFYYPKIMKKAGEKLKNAIKIWMDLQTRIACLQRVQILLKTEKVDIVALLRQVGSPRAEIFKKTQWICFQTEMKIQIWPSQLQTYQNLMKDATKGPFCQLNMGQGKTQVIIPMIILNIIFSQKQCLPRINLLTSLYQEARGNMFKFLSITGFQIPGFEIPFNRKVELNSHNIYAIRDLINCFSGKVYVLVNRQSRLSEILKYNEMALAKKDKNITLEKMPLFNCKLFDIFDEIDAMMTAKKSYIFSIGDRIQLPSANIRLQILKQCIQVFVKQIKQLFNQKIATCDETEEDAIKAVNKGEYPVGLRLTLENLSDVKTNQWKKSIALQILKNPKRHQYSFVQRLSQKELSNLVDYCINPIIQQTILSQKIAKGSKSQIYILRGALAYGILEHCLSKRCGVDYGVPGPEHTKKIAVPYEAADIPSKTSQYEHPEVSAVLSYIAYNMRGLNQDQFKTCIQTLLKLTQTSMESQYQKWMQILDQKQKLSLTIDKAKKINLKSKADQLKLYQIYRKNRKTIAFWLNKCIFPRDLVQYKNNICSSSFDLAHVDISVGFSGTMDNHWLLPNKIKFNPCQTPSIKGTDGKMIDLTIRFTKEICVIQENQKPLWQRLIDLALKKKVGCLIDVGAICVGKSLKKQIVPWIAQHKEFDNQKYDGISFCDQNGKWQIYDVETKFYVNRGTTIPDHQTFVIFDEARTRGADLKMTSDVVAAMSLGPDLTKDKFMQAAGRLRKLGRNQSIIILATHEVFGQLPTFPKSIQKINQKLKNIKTTDLINLILAWCCHNTIHENQNLLTQYANLGWKYVYSKVYKIPYQQQIFSQLKDKYQATLETKTVQNIGKVLSKNKKQDQLSHQTGIHICKLLQKYGKNVLKQAGALDDVCERQVEAEKQKQQQKQTGLFKLQALPQKQNPQLITKIQKTQYNFSKKFNMTQNLINTTRKPEQSEQKIQLQNQLPKSYFVKYNANQFVMISLRQASIFIKQNIIKNNQKNKYKIAILDELTIKDKQIVQNGLQSALVQAKFVSGCENYNLDQQKYLIQFLLRSIRTKNKSQEDRNKQYQDIVAVILKRKRISHKKLGGSTLQKMITKLANQDLPDNHKQEMKVEFKKQLF